MNTNQGYIRFKNVFNTISEKIKSTEQFENKGLNLYFNDLRTPLFHLEALCRIYKDVLNKKRFDSINTKAKALEDAIGALDYFIYYKKQLSNIPSIDPIIDYLNSKIKEKNKKLNQLLEKDHWLDGIYIDSVLKKLENTNWTNQEHETKLIEKHILKEIEQVQIFIESKNKNFSHLELEIHELRRDIRWISIYPHALQGLIQLSPSVKNTVLEKNISNEAKKSAFNVFPIQENLKHYIQYYKTPLLILSDFIANLGTIKDNGLLFHILTEAIQNTEYINYALAKEKAIKILSPKFKTEEILIETANNEINTFYSLNILDGLIHKNT